VLQMMSGFLVFCTSVALCVPYAPESISGYLLGYTGGNRRGTFAILTANRILLIDKHEDTKYAAAVIKHRLFNGVRLDVKFRPCDGEGDCDGEPESRRGVATNVYLATMQRPDFQAAFRTINDFLSSVWTGQSVDQILTTRCKNDPDTRRVMQQLLNDRSPRFTATNLGIGAWSFVSLSNAEAQAIVDPTLFGNRTSVRIQVLLGGGRAVVDRVRTERPETFGRFFGYP
jgi:hypothetical protein